VFDHHVHNRDNIARQTWQPALKHVIPLMFHAQEWKAHIEAKHPNKFAQKYSDNKRSNENEQKGCGRQWPLVCEVLCQLRAEMARGIISEHNAGNQVKVELRTPAGRNRERQRVERDGKKDVEGKLRDRRDRRRFLREATGEVGLKKDNPRQQPEDYGDGREGDVHPKPGLLSGCDPPFNYNGRLTFRRLDDYRWWRAAVTFDEGANGTLHLVVLQELDCFLTENFAHGANIPETSRARILL